MYMYKVLVAFLFRERKRDTETERETERMTDRQRDTGGGREGGTHSRQTLKKNVEGKEMNLRKNKRDASEE